MTCERKTVYISYESESTDNCGMATNIKEVLTSGGFHVTDIYFDGKPGAPEIHERQRLIEAASWTIILKTADPRTDELKHEEAMAMDVAFNRKLNNVLFIGNDKYSSKGTSFLSLDHGTWKEDLLNIVSNDPPANYDVCYHPHHEDLANILNQVTSRPISAPAHSNTYSDKGDSSSSYSFSYWLACKLALVLKKAKNDKRAQMRWPQAQIVHQTGPVVGTNRKCINSSEPEACSSMDIELSEDSTPILDPSNVDDGSCSDPENRPLNSDLTNSSQRKKSLSLKDSDKPDPLNTSSTNLSVCSNDTMNSNFLDLAVSGEEITVLHPTPAFQPDVYVNQPCRSSSVCVIL